MKKVALLVAAALVLTLAFPAVAAPSIQLSGSLETKFKARLDDPNQVPLENENLFSLKLGLSAGEKTKIGLELAPWEVKQDPSSFTEGGDVGVPFKDVTGKDPVTNAPLFPWTLSLRKAYLETQGSFWNGGPEVKTTIGDMTVNQGPIVGDLGNRKGVQIEGFKVGPVGVDAFYAWEGGLARVLNADDANKYPQLKIANTDRVAGLRVNAAVDPVEVGFNVIRSESAEKPEYAVTAKAEPAEKLALEGFYAVDRTEAKAYKVNATGEVMPNVTLTAGYRVVDDAFLPLYASRADSDQSGAVEADEWTNDNLAAVRRGTGYNLGVETTQAGVHMKANYDDPQREIKLAADTQLSGIKLAAETTLRDQELSTASFSAEKGFTLPGADVTGKYQASIDRSESEDITHELSAEAKINAIRQLQGLTLNGKVDVVRGEVVDYETGAKYLAPNGIELGVSHSKTDGTQATAGLKVQF